MAVVSLVRPGDTPANRKDNASILIIDGRHGIRQWMSKFLEQNNWEVRVAANVPEALSIVENSLTLLAIIHHGLDEGEGLLELLREMRKREFNGEVVVLTDYSDTKELLLEQGKLMLEAGALGVKYWMVKPFDLDDFCQMVIEAMSKLTGTRSRHPGPDTFGKKALPRKP